MWIRDARHDVQNDVWDGVWNGVGYGAWQGVWHDMRVNVWKPLNEEVHEYVDR